MSQNQFPDPSTSDSEPDASGEGAVNAIKDALSGNKGKLAVGVAATLGLMVFYKWRERQLAKDDPEDYARLQRLKAGVKSSESHEREDRGDDLAPGSIFKRNRKDKGAGAP